MGENEDLQKVNSRLRTDATIDATTDDKTELKNLEKEQDQIGEKAPGVDGESERRSRGQEDVNMDEDSEAETLIQSPEKKRLLESTTISHIQNIMAPLEAKQLVTNSTSDKENSSRKRKRPTEASGAHAPSRNSSHRSSPLSSPVIQAKSETGSDVSKQSRHSNSVESDKADSITDQKNGRLRRRRPSEVVTNSSLSKRSKRSSTEAQERRETRSATFPRNSDDDKSASPEPPIRRSHKRVSSTQISAGDMERRKRGRPPNPRRNMSADRASESSEDESELMERTKTVASRLLLNDNDTMSPAKTGPRKWKDKNGRTFLARACASEDLDAVQTRLTERPDDIDVPDNAGNTPLQIASLAGLSSVVELLVKKGASVNVRNQDLDTPLIDAVDNGHVEVVKLLLDHGANPRMANAKGDEPLECLKSDNENYEEIRSLIKEAKKNSNIRAVTDEIIDAEKDETSSRAGSGGSPRNSPPLGPRSPLAAGNKRRTGRSDMTRNELLWTANTQENLTKLAGKGDIQGVTNILNILEKADTESCIAAAKAGHENVLSMLIALGKPDPDPEPVRSSKVVPGHNTPMLAAIGRGHPDVVRLLVIQSGFDPTRLHRGKTYYEIAEDRKGERWEREYEILRQAFDRYRGRKMSSPRKTRDEDGVKLRSRPKRRSSSSPKRQMSSPESSSKVAPATDLVTKEKRKFSDPTHGKRRSNSNTEPGTAILSDAEPVASAPQKIHRTRRSQSEFPPPNLSDQEPKRRRLVTGKEHRNRVTVATSSDNEVQDESSDNLEQRSQSPRKRNRISSTPEEQSNASSTKQIQKKKRKIVLDTDEQNMRSCNDERRVSGEQEKDLTSQATRMHKDKPIRKDKVKTDPEDADAELTSLTSIKHESSASLLGEVHDAPSKRKDSARISTPGPESDHDEDEEPYSPPDHVESVQDLNAVAAELKSTGALQDQSIDKEQERAAENLRKKAEEHLARAAALEAQAAEEAQMKADADAAAEAHRVEEEAREGQRQEQERLRLETEARMRREYFEAEKRRMDALPLMLAQTAHLLNENDAEAKSFGWLSKFLPLYVVKTKAIETDTPLGIDEEEWLPNYQVAGLLGIKDLKLLSYTSLDKKPATAFHRQRLWQVSRRKMSYDDSLPYMRTVNEDIEMEAEAQKKFMALSEDELFWVKLSDFMDQVPHFEHLRGVRLDKQPIQMKQYGHGHLATSDSQKPIPDAVALKHTAELPNGILNPSVYMNGTS